MPPPGTDPDPGLPVSAAVAMAQSPDYMYQPTEGAWLRGGALWCLDATGTVVQTTDAGALRVYRDAADKLARSTSHTATTFESSGTWMLVVGSGEVVAVAC